ncbi:MAG TPA: hypothetical protein VK463_17655, partial [Desulfomonilaceae bacterium]|nr:hypothetical protein [Desulfomonilaceae bacterium]
GGCKASSAHTRSGGGQSGYGQTAYRANGPSHRPNRIRTVKAQIGIAWDIRRIAERAGSRKKKI